MVPLIGVRLRMAERMPLPDGANGMDVIDGKTQVTNGDLYSTKPGSLAGRYLRRFWQPLGRSQDVEIGRAYTKKIMDQLVTVYRGENGRVHVVQSHCPHRATL